MRVLLDLPCRRSEISPSLIIIAVIDEVECQCHVTGVPYLQVDVADTTRWHQQAIPVHPCLGIGDISFISNDEKLAESFEGWNSNSHIKPARPRHGWIGVVLVDGHDGTMSAWALGSSWPSNASSSYSRVQLILPNCLNFWGVSYSSPVNRGYTPPCVPS